MKVRDLLGDARLVANTILRALAEDPLWFGVQATRRFVPRRLREGAARWAPVGLGSALAAFLADRPLLAAEQLGERARSRGRTSRTGDRIAGLLAVQVGALDALPGAPEALPESTQVQLALAVGDLNGAIAKARPGRERDGLVAQRRLMQPGFALEAGPQASLPHRRPTVDAGPRVLHILTNALPYTRSGYTERTQAILAASRARGIDIEAVTRIGYPVTIGHLGAPERWVVDGVPYRRLRCPRLAARPDVRLQQQVDLTSTVLERFAPTVLHTTTDFTNALVTQALAARHGLPWVYEMRGQLELTWIANRPAAFQERATHSERVSLLRAKEAELALAADAVVVLSDVQRADLVARGVPSERIHVAPNSVEPGLLVRTTNPGQSRRLLGLPEAGLWAGTVSALVDYEGLDTFVRAVAVVRASGHDLRAAIVGDGVARPSLEALASSLGVADAVVFPGRRPRSEALHWYEAVDVFVVPRRDTPVCRMVTPLKLVEALALGRPVLASDLPALRELVDASGGGRLVAPGVDDWASALGGLLVDPESRGAHGERGRRWAAQRTWGSVAATLEHIYGSIGGSR